MTFCLVYREQQQLKPVAANGVHRSSAIRHPCPLGLILKFRLKSFLAVSPSVNKLL